VVFVIVLAPLYSTTAKFPASKYSPHHLPFHQNIHSRNGHEKATSIAYFMFFFKWHISLCQQVLRGP
jgi:hypothetical protein